MVGRTSRPVAAANAASKNFRHPLTVGPLWAPITPDMGVALSPLPFHPITKLQAIGFTSRGPIWPVMGGSEDGSPAEQGQQPGEPGQQRSGQQPGSSDKGFPENTPLAQMTTEQQLAYFKHQNRQADNKLSAFNGFTPQDVGAMWQRLEALEGEKLSGDQRALREAATKAANDAKTAAAAELLPRVQAAELKATAASVIHDQDQLNSFLAIADPSKFIGESGAIDEERVIGHLTALYGGQQNGQQQQARSWGQHSAGNVNPGLKPGDAGKAAAARRHGTTTQ